MRLHEITITNLDDYKSKKSSNEFKQKIQRLANDMPDIFANQTKQETWFNNELNQIMQDINKPFQADRLKFAHIAKDYSKNTTLLDILYFTADENQQVANFIKENIKKLTDSILSAQSKIKQLIIEADKLKWAAPFRRYTQLGYVLNHLNSYLSTFTSIARSS